VRPVTTVFGVVWGGKHQNRFRARCFFAWPMGSTSCPNTQEHFFAPLGSPRRSPPSLGETCWCPVVVVAADAIVAVGIAIDVIVAVVVAASEQQGQ
jgi:hypothetical protein